jgi:hypothetical protein
MLYAELTLSVEVTGELTGWISVFGFPVGSD